MDPGGTAVGLAPPEDPESLHRVTDLRFIQKSHRRHYPTDYSQAQPEDPDLCIGRPIAFQSSSAHGEDTSKPRVKLTLVKDVGMWLATAGGIRTNPA